MHTLYLSLGSNMGDRQALIGSAVALIIERVGMVMRASSLIETEPWGYESANVFLNQVVCVDTDLQPSEALVVTQEIERELGRTEKSSAGHYSDRLIDIDLLMYDSLVMDTAALKLPHPLMHLRRFVLEPLVEIAPGLVHPGIGLTVTELLNHIPNKDGRQLA